MLFLTAPTNFKYVFPFDLSEDRNAPLDKDLERLAYASVALAVD